VNYPNLGLGKVSKLLEVKYLRVGFINQSISRSKLVPFRANGVSFQQQT
jgi:hypothetical protein